MFTAILGGIVTLGSAVMGLIGSNKIADTQAAIAQAQLEAARMQADSSKYITDQQAIDQQYNGLFALEKQNYFNAGLQTGLLILAIIVVGLIFVFKKTGK